MAGIIDRRMREQGIELPTPSVPGADYVPFVRTGDLIFLTGQLAQWNGERRFIGKVGPFATLNTVAGARDVIPRR